MEKNIDKAQNSISLKIMIFSGNNIKIHITSIHSILGKKKTKMGLKYFRKKYSLPTYPFPPNSISLFFQFQFEMKIKVSQDELKFVATNIVLNKLPEMKYLSKLFSHLYIYSTNMHAVWLCVSS